MRRRVAAAGTVRDAVVEHLLEREASWRARNMPQMAAYFRRPLDRILAGEPVEFESWELCNIVPTMSALDGRWLLQPDGDLVQLPPRQRAVLQ